MDDIITFFRRRCDLLLDFLITLSNPEYITEKGQERIDGVLVGMKKEAEDYLLTSKGVENE